MRKKILEFIESYDKSVPIFYVAEFLQCDWQHAKEWLEAMYQDGEIGKLKAGRYCRLAYMKVGR